jgi:hypothetical protein
MPHFVLNNTSLPYPKTDLDPLPDSADPTKYVSSLDWNTICQGLIDVKSFIRGAPWLTLTPTNVDPAPLSIANYLWLSDTGQLMVKFNGVSTAVGGGGGGGEVPAVVFDNAAPGDNVNIRSDRSNQSVVDNTKVGITNLGSQSGTEDPSATGATGDYSTIGGGHDHTASGTASTVIGGAANNASGPNAIAGGSHAASIGDSAVSLGRFTRAFGDYSVSLNETTNAGGRSSLATGIGSASWLPGQHSHSCGSFGSGTADGSAQTNIIVMRGHTTGSGVGETTELLLGTSGSTPDVGDTYFTLNDNSFYTITVTAVASGGIFVGSPRAQSFRRMYCVRCINTVTLLASGALEQIGESVTSSWTLTGSADNTAGPKFKLLFSTGSTTAAVSIVARVEFVGSPMA